MSVILLDYQPSPLPRPAGTLPRILFPILLTFAHVNLCWQITTLLLPGVCNTETHPATVWSAAAWTPGAAVMNSLGILPGLLLILAASALAGTLTYDLLRRRLAKIAHPAGHFAWRLWVVSLLWCAWLPVPGNCSFVWQFKLWAVHG